MAFLSEQCLAPFCHLGKNVILLYFMAKNKIIILNMCLETASHLIEGHCSGVQEWTSSDNSPSPVSLFPMPGWRAGSVDLRTANKPGLFPLSASVLHQPAHKYMPSANELNSLNP